jgi:hypothetical protein
VSGLDMTVGPVLRDRVGVGGILGQGVGLVSSSVSPPFLCVHVRYKTLLYQNLNQKL